MKQTLSMLGVKFDWLVNTPHLAHSEIYGSGAEKGKSYLKNR
ncbi:MAG: hypothetical protein WBP64_14620 [Nitrososphaeraceae archaeon]